jgi:O-methyltransferase
MRPTVAVGSTPRPAPHWVDQAPPGGEIWECGVHTGLGAAALVQRAQGRLVRLFDTFSGRPEGTPEDGVCSTSRFDDTSVARVQDLLNRVAATGPFMFHVGLVPNTFQGLEGSRIAYASLDMDLYAPMRAAIGFIWPRLLPGGVLVVDDAVTEHAHKLWPGVAKAVAHYPDLPWQEDGQLLVAIHD